MEQSFLITNNELENYITSTSNFNIYYVKLNEIKEALLNHHQNSNLIHTLNKNKIIKLKYNIDNNIYYLNDKQIDVDKEILDKKLSLLKPLYKKSHKILIDKNSYLLKCYEINNEKLKFCFTNKINQYTSIYKYLSFNVSNIQEFKENNLFNKINGLSVINSNNILFKDFFNISTSKDNSQFFPDNYTLSNFMKDLIKDYKNNDLEQTIYRVNLKYKLFISKNDDPIKLTYEKIKNYFDILKSKNDPILMSHILKKISNHIESNNIINPKDVIKFKNKMNYS